MLIRGDAGTAMGTGSSNRDIAIIDRLFSPCFTEDLPNLCEEFPNLVTLVWARYKCANVSFRKKRSVGATPEADHPARGGIPMRIVPGRTSALLMTEFAGAVERVQRVVA